MSFNSEIVVSFDTTGSMYPCLTQVRREVATLTKRLFDAKGFGLGIIAHGDYCDGPDVLYTSHLTEKYDMSPQYRIRVHEISDNRDSLVKFVNHVPPTNGGDADECYEEVLHIASKMSWSAPNRALIIIGDSLPHGPNYAMNKKKLDWRNELAAVAAQGVKVYAVHALPTARTAMFYDELAKATGGFKFELHQFSTLSDLILAISMKQNADVSALESFSDSIKKGSTFVDKNFASNIDILLGKTPPAKSNWHNQKPRDELFAVPAWRFQLMKVDETTPISKFVADNGLAFKPGKGFYQFTKREEIQEYKEIVLRDKNTGLMFTGPNARDRLGLPRTGTVKISPTSAEKYMVFVQSTSYNRKLQAGTFFLYEVDETPPET